MVNSFNPVEAKLVLEAIRLRTGVKQEACQQLREIPGSDEPNLTTREMLIKATGHH
jgi:hypothetical protein